MDEVERPYRLVVGGGGLGRSTGEEVSLGVLDHDWLRRARTSACSLSSFPRKREPRMARAATVPWTPAFAGATRNGGQSETWLSRWKFRSSSDPDRRYRPTGS